MEDFLKLTLDGSEPEIKSGHNKFLEWHWLAEGILQFIPKVAHKKAIILSAGIHGNETAPIEILNQICSDLIQEKLALKEQVLVIFGHPAAMRVGQRYLDNDFNRMFCAELKSPVDDLENKRALQLEQSVEKFFHQQPHDVSFYHYDLHTAIRSSLMSTFALIPFQKHAYDSELFSNLAAAKLDAIVLHSSAGKTFSSYTSEYFGAHSCTLELGKAKPFATNNLSDFKSTDLMLRALICAQENNNNLKNKIRYFKVIDSIIKKDDDFKLNVDKTAPNFTLFSKGQIIAEQNSGNYVVNLEKVWILFPNPEVKKGLRAGLLIDEIHYTNEVFS